MRVLLRLHPFMPYYAHGISKNVTPSECFQCRNNFRPLTGRKLPRQSSCQPWPNDLIRVHSHSQSSRQSSVGLSTKPKSPAAACTLPKVGPQNTPISPAASSLSHSHWPQQGTHWLDLFLNISCLFTVTYANHSHSTPSFNSPKI